MKKSPFKKFISIKANHYPKDRIAIVHGNKRITWKELNEHINRLGNGLRKNLDAEKGDKIALILYNSPEFLESNFACQGIGAIPTPINYRLVGNEFEYIINNCDAKILIFDEDLLTIIQEIRDKLPLIEHYIFVGPKENTPEDMINYYQLIEDNKNKELKANVSYNDIGLILYTGGTTGMPKGVVLTYDNLVTNIEMVGVFMTNALPPVSKLEKGKKSKNSLNKKIQQGMKVLSGLSIFQALSDEEDLAKKISIIEILSDSNLKIPPMTATGGEDGLELYYGKAKEWDIHAKVFLGQEIRDLAESGPLSYSTRGKLKNFFPMIWKYLVGGSKGVSIKGPLKLKFKLIGASTKTPTPEDIINLLLLPPLFHSAGYIFLVQWLLFGCKLVMPENKSFNPKEIIEYLHNENIHITLCVPTMWKRIIEYPNIKNYDFKNLIIAMSGGALLKGKYKKKMIELFPNALIFDALGQTEMSPIVSVKLDGDVETVKDRSIGKMIAGLEYKIVNDDGKEVPDGEIGEICYKSSTIMKEYYKDQEKTKASMTEDGYFYSGDLAYRGEDGEVYIVDRKKSCINTGGEKVYALEVEECIMDHPKVKNVCVIGVPNDEWGSIVRAVVELKKGESTTEEEIKNFCKGKIAGFKKPRSVIFIEEFPITPVGKIQRGKVKKKYGIP